jgi:DNA-binding HxlR family transcriptional regulator
LKVTKTSENVARPPVDSVERALDQISDRWSFLLLREAYFGVRRFDQFQEALGASPNILADRLKKLVAIGVFERVRYSERPPRDEYRLTEKGRDLYPAIVALMRWGDRWLNEASEPPLSLVHATCGKVSRPRMVCDCCGEPVAARDMSWRARSDSA